MGNICYCRFRNTLIELEDCVNVLESGGGSLSNEEQRAAFILIKIARELTEMFEDMNDEEINGRLKEIDEDEEY